MHGFSHGYVSSFLLVCFLLIGLGALTEEQKNGYEPL